MGNGVFLLAFVTVQRAAELILANRNTRRLMARGACERGAGHYPYMVAFHAGWLGTMWLFGWNADLVPFWVFVFAVLQIFRVWILVSLGSRWTTRIIILNEPLVRRGPYRFMKHPNYALVVGEIAVVPLALGMPLAALIFSVLNIGVLAVRIRAEDRALAEITAQPPPPSASDRKNRA